MPRVAALGVTVLILAACRTAQQEVAQPASPTATETASPGPTTPAPVEEICDSNVGSGPAIGGKPAPSPFPTPDQETRENPVVRVSPDHGPPGAIVEIEGYEFQPCFWFPYFREHPGEDNVFLIGDHPNDPTCEVVVHVSEREVSVDAEGHLQGHFRVGREAGCKQTGRSFPTPSGGYGISIGCYACHVGTFRITEG